MSYTINAKINLLDKVSYKFVNDDKPLKYETNKKGSSGGAFPLKNDEIIGNIIKIEETKTSYVSIGDEYEDDGIHEYTITKYYILGYDEAISYEFLELLANKLDQEKIVPYTREQFLARQAEKRRIQQIEFDRLAAEQAEMARIAKEHGSDIAETVAKDLEKQALKIADQKTEVSQTFRTGDSTSTLKGRWVCEVIDEKLVPREYCEPVNSLLNAAVKNGVREIAGCKVYEYFSTASK